MATLRRLLFVFLCATAQSTPTERGSADPQFPVPPQRRPRRASAGEEDGSCGAQELRSDADVQAVSDCRSLEALVITEGVTALSGLENLTSLGELSIIESSLSSLEGLQNVLTIGDLSIKGNEWLVSLTGLESLTFIDGDFEISENPRLASLSGLESLKGVDGDVELSENPKLASLASLSNLESIHGDFDIKTNNELSSLIGLERLIIVEGEISIEENPSLVTLSGLDNLQSAESLFVVENSGLRNLTGLENLTSLWSSSPRSGDLEIDFNGELESILALRNLQKARDVAIKDNLKLTSLRGLEGLTRVLKIEIEDNGVASLVGLDNLAVVDDDLWIDRNAKLTSLSGLESLTTSRVIRIESNWALTSITGLRSLTAVSAEFELANSYLPVLEGLESLRSVGQLSLLNMHGLKSLAGLSNLAIAFGGIFLNRLHAMSTLVGMDSLNHTAVWSLQEVGDPDLATLGGPLPAGASVDVLEFGSESWPACVTPHERDVLVRSVRFLHVSHIPDASWARWRENSCGWELFHCFKGHICRVVLSGNNGSVQSIFISDRNGGCGRCSSGHQLSRNVTWNGEADFGFALSSQEAGSRAICRCGEAVGPVAQLLLRGPLEAEQLTVCARGTDCTVELKGEGLEPRDLVVLTTSCEAPGILSYGASWVAENEYVLNGTTNWYAAPPTRYEVCWRSPCTSPGVACQEGEEDRYFKAGYVELHGVYARNHSRILGQNLSVPNIGFGVVDGDRMRLRRTCGKADKDGFDTFDASSSGMVFDFGELAPDRILAGTYHLCWCRVRGRDGVECNTEQQFAAQSGSVEILCPAGQELTDAESCHACPAGTNQPEPGLETCSLCPAGQFSPEGALNCAACPDGTYAKLAGSITCVACQPWQSADADSVGCSTDYGKVTLAVAFLLVVGLFCVKLVQVIRVKHPVVDVSLEEKRTIVTIHKSHGLSQFGTRSFRVKFENTGHPELDNLSTAWRAKVKDAARLELLAENGDAVKKRLDTSMGTLVVPFPRDLYHTGWLVPMAVFLPLLWIMVVVGGVVLVTLTDLGAVVYLGAPCVVLVCTGVTALVRLRGGRTPLLQRLEEFAMEPTHIPKSCLKGAYRAVTVGQLHELRDYFRDFILDRTAYYLTSNILVPVTKTSQLSYAEWAGPSEVEWFVSHFWGTPFQHFCTALQKHAETVCVRSGRLWPTVRYWVCFCSNNQHCIAEEVGKSWRDSSFYVTLKSGLCHGTCMVLDDQALPLTRAWCIFELLQTLILERDSPVFEGLLLCTSSGVLNNGSGSVDVAMALARRVVEMDLACAKASNKADENMIRLHVTEQLGDFSKLNSFVRTRVHSMLVSAKQNAGEQFGSVLQRLADYVESFTV